MRDVIDSGRAMSLGSVKMATFIVGALLFAAAVLFLLSGLGQIFDGQFLSGLTQIVASAALLGSCYLVVRLLAEILAAMHRLNDRLTILGDDLRSERVAEVPVANEPPVKKATKKLKD